MEEDEEESLLSRQMRQQAGGPLKVDRDGGGGESAPGMGDRGDPGEGNVRAKEQPGTSRNADIRKCQGQAKENTAF